MRQVQLREVLGKKVLDPSGETVGHLEEVEADRGRDSCAVRAYIVEHRGLLDRLSGWALTSSMRQVFERNSQDKPYRVPWDQMDMADPGHPRTLLPKSELPRVNEDPLEPRRSTLRDT